MKNKNENYLRNIIYLLLFVVTAVNYSCSSSKAEKSDAKGVEKKMYVCSMHPQVVKEVPGDCPICGMFLIEKIVDKNPIDSTLNDVVLPVNESVISSITTVSPNSDESQIIITASGILNYDTRKIRMISAKFAGLIEKSYVKSQFQRIRKGQKIYEIYCPEIYTKQWNYVKLVQQYPNRDYLTIEAHEWLQLLGLTKDQIDSLKYKVIPDYYLTVYSDADGYAVSPDFDPERNFSNTSQKNSGNYGLRSNGIGLNDGISVQTGTPLFKVVDVKSLRADIKVKTEEAGLLKKGQKVFISTEISGGKEIEATVSQVEPLNGGVFQFIKVFFRDENGVLFPGRQIQARIQTGKNNSIWLPESSVFYMGQHKSVFLKDENKFIATVIKTGMHIGNKIEILSGLDTGSKVALHASLLIDSDGLLK